MNRLFLRVYVGIAVALTLGTLGTLYILSIGLDTARRRSLDERLIDSAEFIKARIQADNLFHDEEELWRLSRAARLVFEIKDPSDLPVEIVERLRGDVAFVAREEDQPPQVYALFLDGQVFVGRLGRGDRLGFDGPRLGGFDRFRGGWREGRGGRPERRSWFRFERPPPPGGPSGEWGEVRNLFLLSVIGIPILLVGPAIYFLIRPLDRRINALTSVAERFGEGDLDCRASLEQADAFGELASTFNRMADQIQSLIDGQNNLLRAVSHELRTPMARLYFILDDAEAATTAEEKDEQLTRIQNTLSEVNDLVEELLTYVRMEHLEEAAELESVPLMPVLSEMLEVVKDLREDVAVHVDCEVPTVTAIPRLLKRAILNLSTNAARHARSQVWLRAWGGPEGVQLSVEDDGPGVPEDLRGRVLEPFIRADESRSSRIGGVGLGLAIVSRVVSVHEGTLEVGDSPHGGARFVLTFPDRSC